MASSHSAVRKALRGLEDGLSVFTQQLAAEAAELRRNVDSRPRTGATYYRNILEDLQQRADGLGQELAALEAVSTEAVSLEELVGHSVALYCQNHRQVQELEAQLAQYGYRDLFAPLPPENPLDMLELAGGQGAAGAAGLAPDGGDDGEAPLYASMGSLEGPALCGGDPAHGDALGEVTNRLAGAHLGAAAAAGAACDADSPLPAAQCWGSGGGPAPRTTLKAMAPMTAAKALMRADTPSSLASPEAMSPSMRELLGKYAASTSSGGTHLRASTAPGSAGAGTPPPDRGGQSMSPAPAYLSPAFQLAAMEQEVQMAHAEAAAAAQGGTPSGAAAPGWQADDAMYSALTATARKLAGKPSFMEAYRQKFPAIMASTERLLQTVEKQRRPAAAAAVAEEEAAAGPVAALALAAAAAAGRDMAAPSLGAAPARQQAEHGLAAARWHSLDAEESTLDLMAQVIHSRPAAGQLEDDVGHAARAAAYPAGSTEEAWAVAPAQLASPLAQAAAEAQAPSTAFLLNRALGSTAAAAPAAAGGSSQMAATLHADQARQPALAAAAVLGLQSAPRSERSKPQLEQAIAAALGRTTTAAPTAAAAAPPARAPAATNLAAGPASATLPASWPAATPAAPSGPMAPPLVPPGSTLHASACPPPPPAAAPALAAATAPAAQAAVPPLRPVADGEYAALPTFIRSGLPLDTLNAALAAVHAMVQERGANGFAMEDVEASGLAGAKHKVVVNSLVKLGRVQLHVARGGQGGTLYLLV